MRIVVIALCTLALVAACSSSPSTDRPVELRRAVLTWSPVTTATDGSEVTDLVGYRLEIDTPQGAAQVELPPTATSHTLVAPTRGGYTFRLIAISASRGESDASNTVTKTFLR